MLNVFWYLLISVGINLLMFIPAFIFKTDKLTDLSYALSFIILAVGAIVLSAFSVRSLIVTLMVVAWGLRLGIFLFVRIRKIKKDSRFDGIRESFPKFLQFWFLQGVSVWVILIPSLIYIGLGQKTLFWPGFAIWLAGLLIETIADLQKYSFNQEPKNKGQFISTGLWRYSRHPNYFGEMLCWIGIYLFVFLSFSPMQRLFGLASPLYISILLLFVTGLPPLERSADQKWGKSKEYQEYKKSTSILIPWFKLR